ncbi:MarR family transcriptional regulator [Mycolicibacterium brumae]|uniref:MarR family transcriptional regulator n=1 Tax=Mycolicibacterium brumae TaxID=85968 RepID=A0A2G5PHH9_9MYCO|nr:MarR family transcriptional regulator [Mycolicibacterium brumae]PIB77759.1 MarR family transcriptional regulator [Mycolicibacterium brumae]
MAADLTARFLSDRTSVSAPAAYVLNRIDHGGPERLTTLATLEGVSQPSMTQLIQRMERHGLVSRRADADDGRVVLVGLTDEGRALLDQRRDARRRRLGDLLPELSDEDRATLLLSLKVAAPILAKLTGAAETRRRTDDPPGGPATGGPETKKRGD